MAFPHDIVATGFRGLRILHCLCCGPYRRADGSPSISEIGLSNPCFRPNPPQRICRLADKGGGVRSDDPATADAANGDVLKEYGFVRLETAAYTRDDGRNLTVKAAVFDDASGAYGAFTYYVSEEMHAETIGDAGLI